MNAQAAQGDASHDERARRFAEFLDTPHDQTNYGKEIADMLTKKRTRLVVSLDELREFDRDLWRGVLDTPSEYLPAMIDSLKEKALATREPDKHVVDESTQFFIGFRGTFGSHLVNPRTVDASYLGKILCVEGIVTRCTIVRPKIARSVHYNDNDGVFTYKDYRDSATSFDPMPASSAYPTDDGNGHRLVMEYGLSTYRDHQTISLQEMPEKAPAGQLPRGIDIIMDDDLVDQVKPGDRVQLVGIYRSVGSGAAQKSTFRNLMIGLNVVQLGSRGDGQSNHLNITVDDIRKFEDIAAREDVFDLLSRSLAPSIYGFEWIKKAVLLMLLGGVEKNLPNGTHIRGDINLLMVGDPSTAKSQMLRFVLNTAPLAVATTGRGSTGVGLTAAVVTDQDTGERRLTAGAMVMADRGVVCIDEFDKMNEVDRVAIHEVMEQQTVTVAKAGIHTSLNARCSVIAAANPIYGRYDPHRDPAKNIALPDSLLSRFDLLFVVTDDVIDTQDRMISEHVLKMHQFIPEGVAEGEPQRENQYSSLSVGEDPEEDANKETQEFERYNPSLHAGIERTEEGTPDILTIQFIKRYIHYSKQMYRPTLSEVAAEHITEVYTTLRNESPNDGQRRTTPITARTLETLIRLSTAHAKLRLSRTVDKQDAERAEQILRYALFRTVLRPGRSTKKARVDVGNLGSDVESEESEEEEEEELPEVEAVLTDSDSDGGNDLPELSASEDEDEGMIDEEAPVAALEESRGTRASRRRTAEPVLSTARMRQFRIGVSRYLPGDDSGMTAVSISDLKEQVERDQEHDENKFSSEEMDAGLEQLARDNKIQIVDGKIYRI